MQSNVSQLLYRSVHITEKVYFFLQTTGIQTIESCTFSQTSFHEETPPPSYENITSHIKEHDQDVVGDLVDVDTEESSPPSYNTAIAMLFSTDRF